MAGASSGRTSSKRRKGNWSMFGIRSYQQLLVEDPHFREWSIRTNYNEATVGKRAMTIAAESWQACARSMTMRSKDLPNVLGSVSEERTKKLEMFALAFLAETGLRRDACEVVHETAEESGRER